MAAARAIDAGRPTSLKTLLDEHHHAGPTHGATRELRRRRRARLPSMVPPVVAPVGSRVTDLPRFARLDSASRGEQRRARRSDRRSGGAGDGPRWISRQGATKAIDSARDRFRASACRLGTWPSSGLAGPLPTRGWRGKDAAPSPPQRAVDASTCGTLRRTRRRAGRACNHGGVRAMALGLPTVQASCRCVLAGPRWSEHRDVRARAAGSLSRRSPRR